MTSNRFVRQPHFEIYVVGYVSKNIILSYQNKVWVKP